MNSSTTQITEEEILPLKWRFDISTFRLIGRDLITDRITAIFELVKNCYDANATRVDIEFYNISIKNSDSRIIIRDNGTGMAYSDIKNKWMVIGTSSKRDNKFSPEPFNRRYVGEKGIGRFAVDKIGEKVNIVTKKKGSSQKIDVEIDWTTYETLVKDQHDNNQVDNSQLKKGSPRKNEKNKFQLTLFTDVENECKVEIAHSDEQGTELIIDGVRDTWSQVDIDRLFKELTKLVSPFYPLNPPFNIYIYSNEYSQYNHKLVISDAIQYSSHHGEIVFDTDGGFQEVLEFEEKTGRINIDKTSIKSFGGVKIKLYYFNPEAKRQYKRHYKGDDTKIDGIKIYRDGLITTPFAEFEPHPDRKRDILGIDKRLWRDIFNRISTRDIIGIVEITKENNPLIIDATNRQDFVDNKEYRDLKEFIIEQLEVFSKVRIYERTKDKDDAETGLKRASEDVINFSDAIDSITEENPALKPALEPLKAKVKLVKASVTKGLAEFHKAQKEFVRKENIYLSLMSLQDYAINISHAVRTSLGKVKRRAEFFKDRYPNADFEDLFKEYAIEIFKEMTTLNKVIDFMLSYAGSNLSFEDFSVKDLIEELFQQYSITLNKEHIQAQLDIVDNFIINANRQFFADIFQNLIANSVKALERTSNRIIKVSGHIDEDQFVLYFSDNGPGIDKGLWDKVFELYFTTTAEQGGAGIGLYVVKTRIEALRGTVEVRESELKPTGTTFKITFPFNKEP